MADDDRIRRAELAREEARETINEQATTLADIDEKAIQIFRVNVVLAGIIVSGISIAVQSDATSTTALLNPFTKFGAVLLFVATILSSVTYTSTSQQIGISSHDITERILNTKYRYELIEEGLAEEYGNWIATNYQSNIQNALWFTLTLLTTVMAICYFFVGAIHFHRESLPWYTNVGALIIFLGIAKLSGLKGQFNRWCRVTNPRKRFHSWLRAWKTQISHRAPNDEDASEKNDEVDDAGQDNPPNDENDAVAANE